MLSTGTCDSASPNKRRAKLQSISSRSGKLLFIDCRGERLEIFQALLDMLVEQVGVEGAGIMHKRIAQVGQHFQAIRELPGNQILCSNDTEQFMIALRLA